MKALEAALCILTGFSGGLLWGALEYAAHHDTGAAERFVALAIDVLTH
jgi:hypothetical protein